MLKETTELIDASFNTVAQGIESFKDGFQFGEDIPDFIDEALSWSNAAKGLENMRPEALAATPGAVDALFSRQREKLLGVGVHPMLAGAIESNLKGVYFVYATIVQTGGEAVGEGHKKAYLDNLSPELTKSSR